MYILENTPSPQKGSVSRCHSGENYQKSEEKKEDQVKEKAEKKKRYGKLTLKGKKNAKGGVNKIKKDA